jgi:DNA-binding NarL/FixJ family response regulator
MARGLPAAQAGVSIRVFLLDDHEVVRRGVRQLLEVDGDIAVVGEAASAADVLVQIGASHPDVAVLDVRLPDGDGIEVCREVRSAYPDVRCLMFTSFPGDDAVLDAILAGASGYVLKQIRGDQLVDSVRRVAAGQSLLDPVTTGRMFRRLRGADHAEDPTRALSPQERRLLDLMAEGLTNRQIAERMYLAEKTIKNYVSNLLLKLGMRRRTEAAVYAALIAERRRRDDG